MSTDRYKVGEFTLDVSQGCLRRGDIEIALRPKSFALLQHLIIHAGLLVTKDELLSKIWPNVIVTEDSLTRCISEARVALGDAEQTAIKTVPKRGYIFTGPVTQEGDDTPEQLTPEMIQVKGNVFHKRGRMALLAGLLSLAAASLYAATGTRHTAELPRLSLIVLPFANLNADPSQDYLGDIITSELTAALSRLRGATVIAASSALTLKGKPADIKQLGADLDVRYALEGSVLSSAGSVRINASLKDTQTLKTLWSDRFDVDRADILRTQDEIVTRLASTLHGELVQAESRRSRATSASNLNAEDLAMQCEAATYRPGGAGMPGYEWCERALIIDARNVHGFKAPTLKPISIGRMAYLAARWTLIPTTTLPIARRPRRWRGNTASRTVLPRPSAVWRSIRPMPVHTGFWPCSTSFSPIRTRCSNTPTAGSV
jgi:TolB-like protein